MQVLLEDATFVGGWRNPDDSVYRGRTATWVYGARTDYSTMTARFDLPAEPQGDAVLEIVGLDSEGADQTNIQIAMNDQIVFQGPAPFPSDSGDPGTDAPWMKRGLRLRSGLLRQGENALTIKNLEDTANFGVPPWFMVDQATVSVRT